MYILPKPKKLLELGGEFLAETGLRIVSESEELKTNTGWALPTILKNTFLHFAGIEAEITAGVARTGDISLKLNNSLNSQQYTLLVNDKIEIIGGDRVSVGYGIQTLCQIIQNSGALIPKLKIEDNPDILTRGYYLDQARCRILKLETFKKQVDLLSKYKINQYQLYLEQSFAFSGFSEMWRDDTVLTSEEILELDRYCRDRDIDFVPSLASFGHLYELLRTKSYEDICELENVSGKPFTFWDKMQHHTVNVSDEHSFEVIKTMLDEFLPLFSSKYVNICADETFDLGKGKSKKLADKIGTDRMYIEFLKKLCEYVVNRGKIPMFWGDIIRKCPEFITELPKETICLAWGYDANQNDDICKPIAEVGANLYLCPGVATWNNFISRLDIAYSNIKRLSEYAKKYKAIGLLNTDWGDFGHINDPYFSIPGIIYGGIFTWNLEAYSGEHSISKIQLNKQISRIEYGDTTENYVELLEKASLNQLFDWWVAVLMKEGIINYDSSYENKPVSNDEGINNRFIRIKNSLNKLEESSNEILQLRKELRKSVVFMDSVNRREFIKTDNVIIGIELWNKVGVAILWPHRFSQNDKNLLAEKLEVWYEKYKNIYRTSSKEGMLSHVSDVVFWYADRLRGI